VGAEPDEVRGDAGEFIEKDAHPLGAGRDLKLEQLLYGKAVAEVVGHRTEVVDAVGEGDDLLVELGFAGFLDAGVEIADIGRAGDYGLAVDLEHQAEDAMGRGMLRAHIEDHGLVAFGTTLLVVAGGVGYDIFNVGNEQVVDLWGCGGGRHRRYLPLCCESSGARYR